MALSELLSHPQTWAASLATTRIHGSADAIIYSLRLLVNITSLPSYAAVPCIPARSTLDEFILISPKSPSGWLAGRSGGRRRQSSVLERSVCVCTRVPSFVGTRQASFCLRGCATRLARVSYVPLATWKAAFVGVLHLSLVVSHEDEQTIFVVSAKRELTGRALGALGIQIVWSWPPVVWHES